MNVLNMFVFLECSRNMPPVIRMTEKNLALEFGCVVVMPTLVQKVHQAHEKCGCVNHLDHVSVPLNNTLR
jgi:hypothetical protein